MTIKLEKLDYIVVYVSDMQRSVAFYRDVLGLTMQMQSPGWSEFGTGTTRLALHRGGEGKQSEQPARPPAGVAHLAFIVDDLQSMYEELKGQGVDFSLPPQLQPTGRTLAVLRDPDGMGITLQQR